MSSAQQSNKSAASPKLWLLAEFETPDAIVSAAEAVRDSKFVNWDVHTPYPVHGMDDAMGLKPTKLGVVAFIAACIGCSSAIAMIQYMNGYDYPLVVGGKEPDAFVAMVPIMFELSILLTGLTTVFGLFAFCRLPRHHHPVFESQRFERASDDKFFVSIQAADAKDAAEAEALLAKCAPSSVERIEDNAA